MKYLYIKINLILGLLLIGQKVIAQEMISHLIEKGEPNSLQFLPEVYKTHRQNWSFAQDSLGVMYVGNTSHLMIFDGLNWDLLTTPNKTIVRSLARDKNGRIYYGAKGDFGYLRKNSNGATEMISLAQRLAKKHREFGDIWNIHCVGGKTTFQSFNYLFQIDNSLITGNDSLHHSLGKGFSMIQRPKASFVFSSSLNDSIIFQEYGKGLFYLENGIQELIPNSEILATTPILTVIPFPAQDSLLNGSVLICSQYDGLFQYDGNTFEKYTLSPEGEAFFERNNISGIIDLNNGDLLITSYNKGLMLTNFSGEKVKTIDAKSGLIPSDAVSGIYIDDQKGAWISTNQGIARLELYSPTSYFTSSSGIKGNIFDIKRHQGDLFLGTSSGLFRLSEMGEFQKIGKISDQCFSLLSSKGSFLAAFGNKGLWQLAPGQTIQKIDPKNIMVISQSPSDSSLIWVGQEQVGDGFSLLYWNNNTWKSIPTNPPIPAQIRYIAEEAPGIIWLGSATKGYFRVEIPALKAGKIDLSSFNSIDISLTQIPSGSGRSRLFQGHNKVFFGTDQGLKYYDYQSKGLKEDSSLGEAFTDSANRILFMVEDQNKHIWLRSNISKTGFSGLIPNEQGSYNYQPVYINFLKDGFYNNFYPDPIQPDIVWFGGTEKLLRYDFSVELSSETNFPALIRKVIIGNDSIIFGEGAFRQNNRAKYSIPYKNNELRFEFSATHFSFPAQTEYSTFLKGFDEKWSDWKLEAKKDYTNLPEGRYTFQVKARNIYEQESEIGDFSFSILPPWNRSWWAYLLYLILAFGVIYLIIRWRAKRLRMENRRLENIIRERTIELREKNEKLQELDLAKSRLFANISHEFRTPLTVILGTADQIEENLDDSVSQQTQMIRRNSHQLLHLVNQILELQKLESGTLTLEMIQGDIVGYFKYIVESFESLVISKGIRIHFLPENEEVITDYDPEKWLRIISNLLSNAIKFTDREGQIFFRIGESGEREQKLLTLCIQDTGIGIREEKLPYIFDRFYQIDDASVSAVGGTGIGLALVRELLHLMNGKITVTSKYNVGTTFTVTVPITRKAPLKGNIDEKPEIDYIKLKTNPAENAPNVKSNNDFLDKHLPSVLIIEDNKDVVTYLEACLKDLYQIKVANDGEKGIEKAMELGPDLVISDVMMPKKDGFEVCETLKNDERTSHIPIILLTARADFESRISGLKRGADVYLTKPFNKTELLVRIEKLLEIRKQLRIRYRDTNVLSPSESEDIQIEDAFVTKLVNIIHQNIDDTTFKVPQLCEAIGISRSQLHNKIKALTGLPTTHYIRLIRLRKANELLANTELSISEITYTVGFSDPSYFSKLYLQEFGQRPKEARKG